MSIKLKGTTAGSAVILAAPADTSPTGTEKTFTLPTKDGDAGQILKTDGSGALSFTDNLSSGRNLVINGAMRVAQRTTSSPDNGYRTVDRMRSEGGVISVTQSQQTLSSGSPYDEGFRFFMRGAVTSTSSANNTYYQIETRLESQDIAQSGWKYKDSSRDLVCSFWARSSLAGTYYAQYRAIDVNPFHINKSFTLAADTWTKVEHVIPGHSSLVFDNDTGHGFQITIIPHYGTDFTDSSVAVDSWFTRSGDNYLPDFAQNWGNTSNATFDFTGLQLEVGSNATAFEHRSYGDDLARCQRYYYRHAVTSNLTGGSGGYYTTTSGRVWNQFPVTMRAAPTLSVEDFTYDRIGNGAVTATGNTNANTSVSGATWDGVGLSGGTFGQPLGYLGRWNVSAEL
jgi:hypothetical protein|tara:strand:+ start:1753 stop:2943 length:1191 start_codon:yes stop_codon:yes gene_type:complete